MGVLRVELDAAGLSLVDHAPPAGEAAPDMTLALEATPCDEHATAVEVAVTSHRSGQVARRVVPVWDLDVQARPRALALASAEVLLRAAWRDPTAEPPPEPPITPSPPPEPVPEAPPPTSASTPGLVDAPTLPFPAPPKREIRAPSSPRNARGEQQGMSLGAVFEYRTYPTEHTPMLGGRIAGRVRLPRSKLELEVDAGASEGSQDDPLGTVRAFQITGGLGVAQLADVSGIVMSLGPVVEAGYGHVHGDARSPAVGSDEGTFVVSAAFDLGFRFKTLAGPWFTADALGGWSVSGLRGLADSHEVAGMAGALAVVRVGLLQAP
jgi:hypothetical protein